VSGANSAYYGPAWAADGSVLAFIEGSFASSSIIYTMKPDGSDKRIFTELPFGTQKHGVAWKPLRSAP
jgi:hypothetical protein